MKNKQTETKCKPSLGVARHLFTLPIFGSILLGLVLLAGNSWAATSAIEGIVKDPRGQVISGADVRIEVGGGTSWSKVVKTDANGHYIYNGLDVGIYRITLAVNGSVRASIDNVKTKLGNSTKLNFDLKASTSSQTSAPATKKVKHMVWMPAETGTHLGGKWVEVNDNGTVDTAGADNVDKVSGETLLRVQRTSATSPSNRHDGNN